MRIRNIQLRTQGEYVLLVATCKIRHIGEDEVYFKVPQKYSEYIRPDASAFADCLLIPSMKIGEDLIIEGEISEKLYQNLHEVMKILVSWNVDLKPIAIKAKKLVKDTKKPEGVGTFFSGGVDSFYTYLKNKNNKDGHITHLILANGYDIELDNKQLWEQTRHHVEKIAKQEGIEVIEVESNIQPLLEPIIEWEFTFGGCLGAIGILLRNKLKRVYIASSFAYDQQFPGGSTAVTDKYWGAEHLEIVHDGAEARRVEKVQKIASSQLVLDNLRVCYLNLKNTYNCGKCDKCLRTMISLKIAGKLSEAKTFPHEIDMDRVRNLSVQSIHTAVFHQENIDELKRLHKDPELRMILEKVVAGVDPHYAPKGSWMAKAVYLDHMYTKGLLYKLFRSFKGALINKVCKII